jgi:hypothetical protein
VGIPDHRMGELVAAVVTVIPCSKLTEQDIIRFAKKKWVTSFRNFDRYSEWSIVYPLYRLLRMAVPVLVLVRNELLGMWDVIWIIFYKLEWKTGRTELGRKDPEDDFETRRACGVGKTESARQRFFEVVMSECFKI